jgi:hypothetical protein
MSTNINHEPDVIIEALNSKVMSDAEILDVPPIDLDETQPVSKSQVSGPFNLEKFFQNFNTTYKQEFFSSYDGDHFITIQGKTRTSTFKIGKKLCSDVIIKCLREYGYRGGNSRMMANKIMDEFHGEVISKGIKKKISIRATKHQDTVLIDMANEEGKYIEIDNKGVRIIEKSPVPFLNLPKQLPLPTPEIIELAELLEFWNKLFNFKEQNASYIALVITIKNLIPSSGANPILVLEGIQGTGKSTASKIFKKIIDPSEPFLLSPPKNESDVLIMASNSYLIVLDNLEYLSNEMSNIFCRVATGGGISHRILYTDDDEKIYDISRPVIFNGIEELTERADFIERALILYLKPLGKDQIVSENEFWDKFELMYPKLLGGLYSLVSGVLKHLPSIQTSGLHRMTEFHRIGLAIDKTFGFKDGHFTDILFAHHDEKFLNIFQNDLFCQAILQAIDKNYGVELVGTPSELMKTIFRKYDKAPSHVIPKNPRQFTGKLQRQKIVLESNGIEFGYLPRSASRREMFIRFKDESLNAL